MLRFKSSQQALKTYEEFWNTKNLQYTIYTISTVTLDLFFYGHIMIVMLNTCSCSLFWHKCSDHLDSEWMETWNDYIDGHVQQLYQLIFFWTLSNKNSVEFVSKHFCFNKMQLKMSSVKWRPFCSGHGVLTHWPLGDFNLILVNFHANFSEWWLRYLLRNCLQMNATRPVLDIKAGPSVWHWQLLVRTFNFLHISLQINVWISQNSDQDQQLFQLSPEHCTRTYWW